MIKSSRKFELEVHLGLLFIIFVLLILDAASNYIAYQARAAERERLEHSLSDAALTVSRRIDGWGISHPGERDTGTLRRELGLSSLEFFPGALPPGGDSLSRDAVMALVAGHSVGALQALSKDGTIELRRLTRAVKDEYFYLYPVAGKNGRGLIVLGRKAPLLAYLDTVWRSVVIVGTVAALLVLVVYVLLSRFVLSPIRRLRREALLAGRTVDEESDEVEAVVADYRRIIDELRDKESELLSLNREVTKRADSLQQFNEHLLRSMNSGLMTVDAQGRVLSINTVAGEILEIDTAEFTGAHYWDLFGQNVHLIEAVSRVLDCGRNEAYRETEYVTSDGHQLTLGVTISTIHDSSGAELGASLLINDLTELAALRRRLESHDRLAALGEMAGGLAHQIRNSLGAIAGYGNLLKRGLTRHGLSSEHAEALIQETDEAESLIERFLYFARPLEPHLARVDVSVMIQELLAASKVRADCAEASFTFEGSPAAVIEADALLLKQALTNLVENGVYALNGARGSVNVTVKVTEERAEIEVADTGCGIDEAEAERIFTPFFSTRPAGSGLGLPLVKKIIDLHGGELTFNSRVGQGTTFRINLPRSRRDAACLNRSARSETGSSR